MRNPFRNPYVTWHAGVSSPDAEDASPDDPLRTVWAVRTDRRGNHGSTPVKVNDPDIVHTWERTEISVAENGAWVETAHVETGPFPTPKALDYAVYGSVGTLILLIGTLIGASA